MRFLSLFSGIEAASVAWSPLGWECAGVSEIDNYACQLLAQRFPSVPNLGDIRNITSEDLNEIGSIDIVIGGSPCQSFSATGKRKGLQDPRGSLMFQYIRIIGEVRPKWIIWENVQGALSSERGRAFGTLLRCLAKFGYSLGWRVLDARRFGVPQSRKRVFLVGSLGGSKDVYSVLFGENVSRWNDSQNTKQEKSRSDNSPSNRNRERQRSTFSMVINGDGHPRRQGGDGSIACCLLATRGNTMRNWIVHPHPTETIKRKEDLGLFSQFVDVPRIECVRRLSSIEMERLQGFPDNWTDIEWKGKGSKDIRRQFGLGNSMAVPVVRWIGNGIARVSDGNG